MDGTMAAAVLQSDELGTPISEEQLHSIMTETYGKSFGKPAVMSSAKQVMYLVFVSDSDIVSIAAPTPRILVVFQSIPKPTLLLVFFCENVRFNQYSIAF